MNFEANRTTPGVSNVVVDVPVQSFSTMSFFHVYACFAVEVGVWARICHGSCGVQLRLEEPCGDVTASGGVVNNGQVPVTEDQGSVRADWHPH